MTTFMQLVMIKKKLERVLVKDFHTVVNWFYENYVILNTGKCLDTCIGKDVDENETLQISSKQFHQHTKSIFKKAGQKLSAFLRTFPYLEDKKKKVIYNTVFKSQFNYCPLVWMFQKIKQLGKSSPRKRSKINLQGQSNNETSIHQRTLQFLIRKFIKLKTVPFNP